MTPRTGRAATVACALALVGGGCDLFATRAPVVESAQESLWTSPTSPEIVVTNLELAFEIGNYNDYQRALTEDFTFQPDAADVAQLDIEFPGQAIFDGWDRAEEVQVAQTIGDAADSVAVDFVQFDDDLGQTVRLLKYRYVLTVSNPAGDAVFEGEAWFQIAQQDNGEWLIQAWEDVASSTTNDSWGLLKGRNST